VTLGYNIGIILLGKYFKMKTFDIVNMTNYQFQSDYDDALIYYLFSFNNVNFYLPTLMTAVFSMYFEFIDVYTNIFIQMVINQYLANIQENIQPKHATNGRLSKLNEDFAECLGLEKPQKKIYECDSDSDGEARTIFE
jgi:hypothetical protein